MQRVLNDVVLSEVLKSQIPAEVIRLLHTAGIVMKGANTVDGQQVHTTV